MSLAIKLPPSLAMRAEEDAFLSWFSGLGIPIQERKLTLGGFRYHQFSALFQAGDRFTTSHGRSEVRKIAALKCAGECIERQFLANQYRNVDDPSLPPKSLRTSNGWTVHQNAQTAKESAYREALERHLLLKSFFMYGWAGLRLVDRIEAQALTLYFLTSRFTAEGLVSGMVVAKSPAYPGVTFGYSVGQNNNEMNTAFWESAIYEAIDKILALGGAPVDISYNPSSWILSEIKHFLETPFDLSVLSAGKHFMPEPCSAAPGSIRLFNLSDHYGLGFPLYAAHVSGGDLLPLFSKPRLSSADHAYLSFALAKNGIERIPERHPIL